MLISYSFLSLSVQLLLDLMAFREQALRLILDLSSTVITLLVSTCISSCAIVTAWALLQVVWLCLKVLQFNYVLNWSSFFFSFLWQPHQNSLILHAFMDLFCSFVRVNLFSDKATALFFAFVFFPSIFAFYYPLIIIVHTDCYIALVLLYSLFVFQHEMPFSLQIPRKMILQVYNLLHTISRGGRDCEFYHR